MGLFGGDSKTVKRVTNITRTDVDSETVTGVKATGESVVQQAGGDIGLTGARFERVATALSDSLTHGVRALTAGAEVAQRESTERAGDARQVVRAASMGSDVSPSGSSAAGIGGDRWDASTVLTLGVIGLLAVGAAVWMGSR